MKARILVVVALFVVGAAAAVVLVVSSTDTQSLPIYDADSPAPTAEPQVPDDRFAHVKAYLASIPDTKNLATAAAGAPVPHAQPVSMRHFRGERVVVGTIELRRDDQTVGLFQNWMELVPVDASRFLLHRAWHEPEITLVAVLTERLRPLSVPNLTERATAISNGEDLFALDEGAYSEVQIPRDLPPGQHPFPFPPGLREIDEVLLLYPSTRPDASNRTHVMRVEPRQGRITVIAPTGGAFRPFDEAQAPARLFRDPKTGRVVGDGLKLRPFVLNEALTGIDTWLG